MDATVEYRTGAGWEPRHVEPTMEEVEAFLQRLSEGAIGQMQLKSGHQEM
jgi:hypothetical protein